MQLPEDVKRMLDKERRHPYIILLNVMRSKHPKWTITKIQEKTCKLFFKDYLKIERKKISDTKKLFLSLGKDIPQQFPKSDSEFVKKELSYIQSIIPECSFLRPEDYLLKTRSKQSTKRHGTIGSQ